MGGYQPTTASVTTAAGLVRAITTLIGAQGAGSDRFGIAVSGGPDSVALLLLAHEGFPGRIAAATVDHRARPEAALWAEMVKSECQRRGVPHDTLTLAEPISGSFQSRARAARYALLDQWRRDTRLDWILTAHHADDQAETLIMRLNRSSGLSGLAGVRPRNGVVLRPLLATRRSELAAIVAGAGVETVDDPSNHDIGFDRVRFRQMLAKDALLDPVAVSASAAHLADAETAMLWATDHVAAQRMTVVDEMITLDTHDLPHELVRRLMVLALHRAGEARLNPRGQALDIAIGQLERGSATMIGNSLITPTGVGGAIWRFSPAPPRRGGAGS